jgi:biopolymer transport protein ExbD
MIDIFTVLVTFLLMTAIFSRTVVLDLKLPSSNASFPELPKGLNLEIIVRDNLLQIADRGTGPLRTLPNTPKGYDLDGLTEYLKFVKSRFPDKTEATILLEPQTLYDTLVQVMDRTRIVEINAGLSTVQAELFPAVSIGDAPVPVGNAGGAP